MTFYFLGWKARYEKLMIETLSRDHDVRELLVPDYAKKIVRFSKSVGKRTALTLPLDWLARRVNARHGAKPGDVLVCNESQAVRGLNPRLIATFPGVRILLVRDLVSAAFVAQMRGQFDRMFSYDPVQCQQLQMEFLDQFFPFNPQEQRDLCQGIQDRQASCFFLGRDKGRSVRLDALAQVLLKEGCEVDFNIVRDSTSQVHSHYHIDSVMTYEDNLARVMSADILVELNQPGQSGLTLRPLEAAFFDKKLITDNPWVRQMGFYHPDRFYVLGDESRELGEFLRSQPPLVESSVLRAHSPQGLMDRLLAVCA